MNQYPMNQDHLKFIETRFFAFTGAYAARARDPFPYTLKQDHTLRVCHNIVSLARSLNLEAPMVRLAHATALVHDLGRFPQFETYGTYSDARSVNHAALGTGVLVREGLLDRLARHHRQLILRAVALHNRARLPDKLPEPLDTIARLLRDADKIDIYKVMIRHYQTTPGGKKSFVTHELPDEGQVSQAFISKLEAGLPIAYHEVKSINDMKLFQVGMIQDLNFPGAFKAIYHMGMVDNIIGSMPHSTQLNRLAATLNSRIKAAAHIN